MEAPLTEDIFQDYDESVLEVIAIGSEWNQPYSCEEWGTTFGLTYPVLDDVSNNKHKDADTAFNSSPTSAFFDEEVEQQVEGEFDEIMVEGDDH